MEALGISTTAHTKRIPTRERENNSSKTATTEDGEDLNALVYLNNILEVTPSGIISDGNFSDLDLGLGIESEGRESNSPDWEFDSRRADL